MISVSCSSKLSLRQGSWEPVIYSSPEDNLDLTLMFEEGGVGKSHRIEPLTCEGQSYLYRKSIRTELNSLLGNVRKHTHTHRSSCCGTVETIPTRNHKVKGSIPGLA